MYPRMIELDDKITQERFGFRKSKDKPTEPHQACRDATAR
jgi:hypothetical protein